MNNKTSKILVIDETIREGMQHSGIFFTFMQRKKILDFQEKLGVDICQAGYPSAHATEMENIKKLRSYAEDKSYRIQVAGMGRACLQDAEILIKTGITHFHLHANINVNNNDKQEKTLSLITKTVEYIRKNRKNAKISIAVLDIGRTEISFLKKISNFFIKELKVDILSLPDTSGIMSPNSIYGKIHPVVMSMEKHKTVISVHFHNDMGMANANTILGISAGGKAFEATALGIGERNGIADIFVIGKMLKDHGTKINLKTEKTETFRKYYRYVHAICKVQTGETLLHANTPFFGDAVKTHVAGTHGATAFGIADNIAGHEKFFLNILCGKHLVEKYLKAAGIGYNQASLSAITEAVKSESARLQRRLTNREIKAIAAQHT